VSDPATSSLENAAACAAGVTASNTLEMAAAAASGAAFNGARRGVLLVAAGGGGGGARVADADVGTMVAPDCRTVVIQSTHTVLLFRPHKRAQPQLRWWCLWRGEFSYYRENLYYRLGWILCRRIQMDVQDSSTYSANSPQKTTIRRII
jgi:hypothetical protein